MTGPAAPFPGRNTFVNAGRRRSAKAPIRSYRGEAATTRGLELNLAYTYTRARFDEFVNFAGLDQSGKQHSRRAGAVGLCRAQLASGGIGFLCRTGSADGLDRVYVNDGNSNFAEDYTVLNLHAGWRQRLFADWDLNAFVRVDNVNGEEYVGSVVVNAANDRFFEPAPPRTFLLGFTASFSPR